MSKSNSTIVANNGETLRPTPASEMPVPLEGVITVQLETGRVVEMVIGELSMFYELGEIPDELTHLVARELIEGATETLQERMKRRSERFQIAKWLAGEVLRRAATRQGKPDPALKLYHEEIWEIYNLANSPKDALDNFRRQQAQRVVDLHGQQGMAATA